MNAVALSLFDDLALAGPPGSSAQGSTRGSGVPAAPAPGAAPNVRASDPDTSHIAAAENEARASLRSQVHALLLAHPAGATDWELADLLGLDASEKPSVVNRRRECGAVDTGLRRPSPKGKPCVVWALTEEGS